MKKSAAVKLLFLFPFLLLSSCDAAKLLNFTFTKDVVEGEHANFSCTVKRGKGWILWKIGDYTNEDGNAIDHLDSLAVSVEVYSKEDPELEERFAGVGETTRIGILATPEIDGVPVQCVIVPNNEHSTNEYSKFAMINVQSEETMNCNGTENC